MQHDSYGVLLSDQNPDTGMPVLSPVYDPLNAPAPSNPVPYADAAPMVLTQAEQQQAASRAQSQFYFDVTGFEFEPYGLPSIYSDSKNGMADGLADYSVTVNAKSPLGESVLPDLVAPGLKSMDLSSKEAIDSEIAKTYAEIASDPSVSPMVKLFALEKMSNEQRQVAEDDKSVLDRIFESPSTWTGILAIVASYAITQQNNSKQIRLAREANAQQQRQWEAEMAQRALEHEDNKPNPGKGAKTSHVKL